MTRIPTLCLALLFAAAGCDAPRPDGSSLARSALAATALESVEETEVRRVWADARDYASPSPDGRHFAFVDWSTGDVAMYDAETGEETRLTDKGPWTENGSWAEEPLFSPDGRRVAYAYGNAQPEGGGEWRYELQVVDVGDPTQQVVLALTPEDDWVEPMDWSASHGIVAGLYREGGAGELALVDPATGEVTALGSWSEEAGYPDDAWFGPHDERLAYRRDDRVFVRDLASSAESPMELPVTRLLGWAPDGSALLVHTHHRGEAGIWALPLEGTRAAGEPALVRAGLPAVQPSGRAGDRYFYGVVVDAPKLQLVSVDPASGRVLAEPTSLTSPLDGRASHPAWSPDGSSLAYTLENLVEPGLRFMVSSATGDAVREIARGDFRAGQIRMRWDADGTTLLLVSIHDGRSPAFYRIDPSTGTVTQLTDPGAGRSFDVLGEPGRVLVLEPTPPEGRTDAAVVVRDLARGTRTELAALPPGAKIGGVEVGPDERRAAVVYRDPETDVSTLALLDLEDGALTTIHEEEHPVHLEIRPGDLAWTADGRHVMVMRGEWEGTDTHQIVSVPVDGGGPVVLTSGEERRYLALHPDGRRLVFADGDVRTELWVLEGLGEAVAGALARN